MILSFCEGESVRDCSLSLISISSLEASPRWWDGCSQRMVHSVHLKMIFSTRSNVILFSLAEDHLSSRQCVFVCVRVFFFLWIGVTTIQRMSLSNARSRASCSSLTHSLSLSRSRSLVVTMLVLCSFCFFF